MSLNGQAEKAFQELDLGLKHKVADMSLAELGHKDMQLSEREKGDERKRHPSCRPEEGDGVWQPVGLVLGGPVFYLFPTEYMGG